MRRRTAETPVSTVIGASAAVASQGLRNSGPRRVIVLAVVAAALVVASAAGAAVPFDQSHFIAAIRNASVPQPSAVDTHLFQLSNANRQLIWRPGSGRRQVAVAVVMTTETYRSFYATGSGTTPAPEPVVWVTLAPQLKRWCQQLTRRLARAAVLHPAPVDLASRVRRRVVQRLGLSPSTPYTQIVELWVDRTRLFRPCPDPAVTDPIVTGPTDDYQPALSPDGQNLCFTRGAFGTTNATVQRSTATGGNVTQIADSGQGDYNCAWSPDGTKIAYVQGTFSNGNLMVRNSDGSGTATDLVPNVAGRFDGNPDWTRNPSPTCQDQSVTTSFNGTASIPLDCVDPAPENDPVTRAIVSPPAHGSLGSISQNSVTYTPQPGFVGADQFTFKGNDGTSDSNVATIHVTVSPDIPATISSLRLVPARWRLGSRLAQISSKRAPVGTEISFNLSKPARVRFTFAKVMPARLVNRRCVAPNRTNRKRRRCTRVIAAGALSFDAHTGVNRVKFQGRISPRQKLTVGSYQLTVNASDIAGTPSLAQMATFTIVKR